MSNSSSDQIWWICPSVYLSIYLSKCIHPIGWQLPQPSTWQRSRWYTLQHLQQSRTVSHCTSPKSVGLQVANLWVYWVYCYYMFLDRISTSQTHLSNLNPMEPMDHYGRCLWSTESPANNKSVFFGKGKHDPRRFWGCPCLDIGQ